MMKTVMSAAFAALLSLAPLPALAQQVTPSAKPAQPERAAHRGMHDGSRSLGFLVQHRTELGLSDAQVTQLNAIAARLHEKNQPLVEKLRAAGFPAERAGRGEFREMTPEQREAMRARLEANRPTLNQLRENARTAMTEARGVLTKEQLDKVHSLMRARAKETRPEGRGRMGPGGRGGAEQGRMRPAPPAG
jgi:hypothetical protein